MRLKNENSGERLYKIFIYAVLAALAVLILIPVIWVMVASVKETSEHYGSPWALPMQASPRFWAARRQRVLLLLLVTSTAKLLFWQLVSALLLRGWQTPASR